MKHRLIFILFICSLFSLVLLTSFASATEYKPFTNVTVGDIGELYISIDTNADSLDGSEKVGAILHKSDGKEYFIFNAGDCELTGEYEICFIQAVFNLSANKFHVVNYRLYPLVDMSIKKQEPKLTVTKTVEKSVANVNDNIKVTVIIKNDGNNAIENIVYQEYLDDRFSYRAYSEYFKKNQEGYLWKGKLGKGSTRELYYTVSSDEIIKYTTATNISYTFLDKKITDLKIKEKTISFEDNYDLNISIVKNDIQLGEIGKFNFYFNNKDPRQNLIINKLDVYFQDGVQNISSNHFSNKRDYSTNKDYYRLIADEILPATKENHFINFTPNKVGENTVRYELSGKLGSKSFDIEDELSYNSVSKGLSAKFIVENKEGLDFNEKSRVSVSIKNEDTKLTYKNLECDVNLYDFSDFDFEEKIVAPKKETTYSLGFYTAQKYNVDRNVRIYMKCIYQTEFNENLTLIADDFIKVKKYESDSIDIGSGDEGIVIEYVNETEEENHASSENDNETINLTDTNYSVPKGNGAVINKISTTSHIRKTGIISIIVGFIFQV